MVQKNTLWGLVLSLGIGLSLVSCHDSEGTRRFSDKKGGISPRVELNTSVISSTQNNVAGRAINISLSDLALTLKSADGSYSHTWSSVDDFDPNAEFPIGDYEMTAVYGNPDQEGFDRPAYAGSTTFTVLENQTTSVDLTAKLVNSMISIEYSDDFKNYMSTYNAEIKSNTTGKTVYYGARETRPVYVKPGNITLDLSFSTPGGAENTLRIATVTAVPRYHYHVKVGLKNQTGGTSLEVSFDENLNHEEVTIDLSDELLNAPAPTIEGHNLSEGSTYHYIEGNTPERAALNIIAHGGVSEVSISTSSVTLTAQGWPASLTLNTETPASLRQRLTELGLDVRGIYTTPGKLAALDFTDVPPSLEYLDDYNDATFTVQVVDKYSKVSEPYSFKMELTPLYIRLSNPGPLHVAATEVSFDLEYNGDDPETKIGFRVKNERGYWSKVTAKEIKSTGDNKYRVTLNIPASTSPVTVSATAATKTAKDLVIPHTGLPAMTVTVPVNGVWATKADVTISSDEADAALLAKGATYYVSLDGVNYTPASVASVDGRTATITGLQPGSQYNMKIGFGNNESLASSVVNFETEEALPVPNGDFENLTTTYSVNSLNYGGQYRNAATNYWNTVTYEVKEADGWKSVNPKTMCGSNQNTWFSQPAVFNTTLSWVASCPGLAVFETGKGSDTPASFRDFKVHRGSNAMVIRNVAWDPAGSDPERVSTSDPAKYYYWNPTVPTISRRAVGRMFLGSSYTYNKNNRTEVHNQGVAFTSRPTALEGWYYYTLDVGDVVEENKEQARISIELRNGDEVIASGEVYLNAQSEYTKFSCPIEYFVNDDNIILKATQLRIMVESSSRGIPGTPQNENNSVKVSTYISKYEAYQHGATLVVDDFTFVY